MKLTDEEKARSIEDITKVEQMLLDSVAEIMSGNGQLRVTAALQLAIDIRAFRDLRAIIEDL